MNPDQSQSVSLYGTAKTHKLEHLEHTLSRTLTLHLLVIRLENLRKCDKSHIALFETFMYKSVCHRWYAKISKYAISHSTFTARQRRCVIWSRFNAYKCSDREKSQPHYWKNLRSKKVDANLFETDCQKSIVTC